MSRSALKSQVDKGRGAPVPVAPPSLTPAEIVSSVDVVPGRFSESDWVAMVEKEEGELVVVDILDELIQGVMEKCYEVDLKKQLIPFVVSDLRDMLEQLMACVFLEKDRGEAPDCGLLWVEDSEPQPCYIDSWVQGCVPVISLPRTQCSQSPAHLPSAEVTDLESPLSHMESRQLSFNKGRGEGKSAPTEPQGTGDLKGRGVAPLSQLRKDNRKKTSQPGRVAPAVLKAPDVFVTAAQNRAVGRKEGPADPQPAKAYSKHRELPAVRKGQARLPRQYVWPGFKVLETSALPQAPRKEKRLLPAQINDEEQETGRLITHTTRRLYDRSRNDTWRGSRNNSLDLLSSIPRVKEGMGHPAQMPRSSMVMLDSMALSPGVVLKNPLAAPSSTSRGHSPQLGQMQNLEPIRGSVLVPPLSVDQIVSGQQS